MEVVSVDSPVRPLDYEVEEVAGVSSLGRVAVTGACIWTEKEGGSNEELGENGGSAGSGTGGERWNQAGSPRRDREVGAYTEVFQVGGDELS